VESDVMADPLALLPQGFQIESAPAPDTSLAMRSLPEGFTIEPPSFLSSAKDVAHNIATGAVRGVAGGLDKVYSMIGPEYGGNDPGTKLADLFFKHVMTPYEPQGFGEKLVQAGAGGAALGALGGPGAALAGAAGGVGSAIGGPIGSTLLPAPYGEAAGEAVGGLVGGGAAGLAGRVATPIAEAAARQISPAAVTRQAASKLSQRITQDAEAGGVTAGDIQSELSGTNKPLTLMDVGGENVKGAAGNVARTPGPGREVMSKFLNERDAGAGPRLIGDISDELSNGGTAFATGRALSAQRQTAAAPLYGKAYMAPALNPDTIAAGGALDNLMKRPSMPAAANNALAIAKEEGRSPTSLGLTFDADGNVKFEGVPSWQTLDYVKRGLDDVLDGYRDKTTGRLVLDEKGRAINNTRQDFLDFLDQNNPAYASARAAWSGPSQSMSAIKQGQGIFNRGPEQIAEDLSRLSPGDRDFYRLGAANALRDRIAKTSSGGNEANRIIGNDYVQQQLRPLFPDVGSYNRFINAAQSENKMFQTRNAVLGNSATAARLAEDGQGGHGGGYMIPMATAAIEGNKMGMALFASKMVKDLLDRSHSMSPAVNAEMARLLTTRGNQSLPPGLFQPQSTPTLQSPGRAGLLGLLTGQ
jgi:hypothetical protein